MASTIEFNRFVISSEPVGIHHDSIYFAFSESGSRNCTDEQGCIAKSIDLLVLGQGYRFMQEFVQISMDCEGGMLKSNGRNIRPEGYISAWRKAKDNALSLDDYLKYGTLDISFYSVVDQLEQEKQKYLDKRYGKQVINKINDLIIKVLTSDGVEEITETWFDEKIATTRFLINADNQREMINLLNDLMQNAVSGRRIWRARFSQYAWQRGINSTNESNNAA